MGTYRAPFGRSILAIGSDDGARPDLISVLFVTFRTLTADTGARPDTNSILFQKEIATQI
jgi:hypothetical protein